MFDWLFKKSKPISLDSDKTKLEETNPMSKSSSRFVGPFGKYAWAVYDLEQLSIDGGNEIRLSIAQTDHLLCFSTSSPQVEREACTILYAF